MYFVYLLFVNGLENFFSCLLAAKIQAMTNLLILLHNFDPFLNSCVLFVQKLLRAKSLLHKDEFIFHFRDALFLAPTTLPPNEGQSMQFLSYFIVYFVG